MEKGNYFPLPPNWDVAMLLNVTQNVNVNNAKCK